VASVLVIGEMLRSRRASRCVLVRAIEASASRRLPCVIGFEAGDSCGAAEFSTTWCCAYLSGRLYTDQDVQERIPKSRLDWTIPPEPLLTESVEQAGGGFP